MGGWWCPHLLSLTTPRPPQRYPTSPHYNSQNTNCLSLEGPWKSALKADPGARSEPTRYNPINTARVQSDGWPYDPPPQDAMVRPNGTVHAPDLMGIREYGLGRVALLAVYDQFLFGSGEKWLFDNQIMAAGNGTLASDTGKLLRNTLNWLAAPSLGNSSSGVGGYATPPDRLTPYNDRPAVWGALNTTHYHYDKAALSADPAAGDGTAVFVSRSLLRLVLRFPPRFQKWPCGQDGLFGAQTVHGGGQVRCSAPNPRDMHRNFGHVWGRARWKSLRRRRWRAGSASLSSSSRTKRSPMLPWRPSQPSAKRTPPPT